MPRAICHVALKKVVRARVLVGQWLAAELRR